MIESEFAGYLSLATQGDELARERLIRHYKPFILNTVGNICGRYITWNDEESSIGLLAFNRAIDTFNPNGGRTFPNYVYLLIKRDLIDFFRKETKETHIRLEASIDEESESTNTLEYKKSVESYQDSIQKSELVDEILELSEKLRSFQIDFEELEQYCPQHKRTRKTLFEMVEHFLKYPNLIESFLKKKRFPATEFVTCTGFHMKTVERHKKYLITLILLKLNPELRQIAQFLNELNAEVNIYE